MDSDDPGWKLVTQTQFGTILDLRKVPRKLDDPDDTHIVNEEALTPLMLERLTTNKASRIRLMVHIKRMYGENENELRESHIDQYFDWLHTLLD